jgi:hypothetical protein
VMNVAAEVKLRADRRAGELVKGMEKNPGGKSTALTMREVGVDHNQSSRWQLIAGIPGATFEKFLDDYNRDEKEIKCNVHQGTARDAILFAVGANTAHGLPRKNADKRNAVMVLLSDPEWVVWSDNKIAQQASVGPDLVASVRKQLSENDSSSPAAKTKDEPKMGKDGKKRKPRKPKAAAKAATATVEKPKAKTRQPAPPPHDPQPEGDGRGEAQGTAGARSEGTAGDDPCYARRESWL